MHDFIVLPYYYRSESGDFFLRLTEQNELTFSCRRRHEVWKQELVIATGCRGFTAAPDREGLLHIIAADMQNKLAYWLANGENALNAPFVVTNSEGPFLLAFSGSGAGSFCGSQSGRLVYGTYSNSGGWVVDELPGSLQAAFPSGLVMDRNGGSHLLWYEATAQTLLYQYCAQGQITGTTSALARAVPVGALAIIWLDMNQTVHVAWHNAAANSIGYCRKKTGGWPQGGWLPFQMFPVDFIPKYLSLFEQDRIAHLWVAGESGRLLVCNPQDGLWQPGGKDTAGWHPLRIGSLGVNTLNFTAAMPPESWCFSTETAGDGNTGKETAADEQGSLLLLHARQLMEGKKLLESQMQKKEASLLQLRQLLERAQESHTRQRQKWLEQIRQLEGTVQKLTEKLRAESGELTPLKAQNEELQSRLTQIETEKRKFQAEVFSLRSKLGEAQIAASVLREKARELENELAGKKSLWEKFAGLLQKKPEGKD